MSVPATSFEQAILVGVDFDGTGFLTSEAGPNVLTVDDAYRLAIEETIGSDVAARFEGHGHRTPAEIVAALVPDSSFEESRDIERRIIEQKLAALTGQIGVRLPDGALWPRPTEGYAPLWDRLSREKQLGRSVTTAVLSAGHTDFIARTFDTHGLEQPDILITDDVLVDLCLADVPPELRAKPAPLILTLARLAWLTRLGVKAHEHETLSGMNDRIIYAGDSVEKDGGLAQAHGVAFVLIPSEAAASAWGQVDAWVDERTGTDQVEYEG